MAVRFFTDRLPDLNNDLRLALVLVLVFDEFEESDEEDGFFLKFDEEDEEPDDVDDGDVAAVFPPFCCFFFGRYL